jgi:phosphate transport system ATP-binding protein
MKSSTAGLQFTGNGLLSYFNSAKKVNKEKASGFVAAVGGAAQPTGQGQPAGRASGQSYSETQSSGQGQPSDQPSGQPLGNAFQFASGDTQSRPTVAGSAQVKGAPSIPNAVSPTAPIRMETRKLSVKYGSVFGVKEISLAIPTNSVMALIGPSGCGKTTFLRSLNRMHDLTRGAEILGQVLLDNNDIYAEGVNPVLIRRKIGMVFQKPTPFPTLSIYDNVVAGLKLVGIRNKAVLNEVCERALKQAALFEEVKDRLNSPAVSLSGGQQQRLSIARALAVEPEVLLMDEPTSSLDPQGTLRIEELIHELKKDVTIIIITHNMQQAARVSDQTAFFYMGNLIEVGNTKTLFTNPREQRTEDYITGRFG